MRWIDVGRAGDSYPVAVRALRLAASSGVYAIRDKRTGRVLYVGESHTGTLYATMTRHLQRWARHKNHWRGYAGPADPGWTYQRSRVEVTFRVVDEERAEALERVWIRRLKPRDNTEHTSGTVSRPNTFGLPDIPF